MLTIRKFVAGGAIAGLTLAGGAIGAGLLGTANAATGTTTTTAATSTAAADPNPGDNGADGVPESSEVHTGHGGALDLSGTVTAVGASSVTIKTSTATTTYTVTSASDIDKNGEASLPSLVVGDVVTFSVDSTNAKQIDKLHAGDETKDMPAAPSTTSSTGSAGA